MHLFNSDSNLKGTNINSELIVIQDSKRKDVQNSILSPKLKTYIHVLILLQRIYIKDLLLPSPL